jgi:DNA-binding HxlR family transcriptional regulator
MEGAPDRGHGTRDSTPQSSPRERVEYSLTPLGWTLTNAIVALSEWSKDHSGDVTRARTEYCLQGLESGDIVRAPLTA